MTVLKHFSFDHLAFLGFETLLHGSLCFPVSSYVLTTLFDTHLL